jgi:hypothetical protein
VYVSMRVYESAVVNETHVSCVERSLTEYVDRRINALRFIRYI